VPSEDEKFRRLAVELRILEGTVETIQSRINIVNSALTELSVANMTLGGMEKEKQNSSLLVPIGGGSYIKAKLESADTVIVGKTYSRRGENKGRSSTTTSPSHTKNSGRKRGTSGIHSETKQERGENRRCSKS